MPEAPEVRVVADALLKGLNTVFETAQIIENVPGTLHRYSKELPKNWNVIRDRRWQLQKVRVKGKLILFDIELTESKEKWTLLTTLGMSGDYRWNSINHKHTRFAFIKSDGGDLSFNDARCFGTLRIVKPDDAKKLEAKIGWDLLQSPMPMDQWVKLQSNPKIADMQIKPALLTQNLFAGLGNIYACEVLYATKLDPKRLVKNLTSERWMAINHAAYQIMQKAYELKGSSIRDYTADGEKGHAQEILAVYGRKTCPASFKVHSFEQEGRTTWWVPQIQTG